MRSSRCDKRVSVTVLLFVFFDEPGVLLADLVHVERPGLLDEIIDRFGWEHPWLTVHGHLATEHDDHRDRAHVEGRRQLALLFCVDLGKNNILVARGSILEDWPERFAGTTPLCPEVDHDDVVIIDELLEVFVSHFYGRHDVLLLRRGEYFGRERCSLFAALPAGLAHNARPMNWFRRVDVIRKKTMNSITCTPNITIFGVKASARRSLAAQHTANAHEDDDGTVS